MKNVHEMTELECRAEIAEHRNPHWYDHSTMVGWEHPVPRTLDAAASSLPEAWWWEIFQHHDHWLAVASKTGPQEEKLIRHCYPAPTERLARFRCAVAAWRFMKGIKE